jgi:hypothetical protein
MKSKYSAKKIVILIIVAIMGFVAIDWITGFSDMNDLNYTLSLASAEQVDELRVEVEQLENNLVELKEKLKTVVEGSPSVIPFGQGKHSLEGGKWDSRCESPRSSSGGCGALGGDYFQRQQESLVSYNKNNNISPLQNEIKGLTETLTNKKTELSIKDKELTCNIISKIVLFNLDGTKTESSSSIIEPIQALSVSPSDASLKIGDIGVKKMRLIPTIQCESLPAPIKIQSSDLKLVIKSDRTISPISTQDARVKSFELNSSSDYELVIFEVGSNSLLKEVDFGNYQSEFYLSVYGSIGVDFEGLDVMDSKIVIDRDELVTTLKTEISKSDEIREVAKVVVIEPEPVLTEQEFGLPDDDFYIQTSFVPDEKYYEDWSFLENTVDDVVIQQEPLSNVNDQRFTVIVLLGFLFVLIALLVRKYTRKMLIEK